MGERDWKGEDYRKGGWAMREVDGGKEVGQGEADYGWDGKGKVGRDFGKGLGNAVKRMEVRRFGKREGMGEQEQKVEIQKVNVHSLQVFVS